MSTPGLYVHYAYCAHRCVYCDFTLATPKQAPAGPYTDALLAELNTRTTEVLAEVVSAKVGPEFATLYLGGGTPSLWPLPELSRFIEGLRQRFQWPEGAEWTIEANPDDVTDVWLEGILALGFNRVSLGVQSLDDDTLKLLTRGHGRSGALKALNLLDSAYQSGRLQGYSVDLMYGLPRQTLEGWTTSLTELLGHVAPPHLSLYALTVEPRTVLALKINQRSFPSVDDSLQASMMDTARQMLAMHGYTHYEVSSWAQPNHIAKHNSAYWEMRPYLALGAGAHGFLDGRRYQNERRPSRYIERALADHPELEQERPDLETFRFERLMTGLRRLDRGLALSPEDYLQFAKAISLEEGRGRIWHRDNAIGLTPEGLRFMDDVLLSFVP